MMLIIAVGILLVVLHKRGELGPLRWEGRQWEGRPSMAGNAGPHGMRCGHRPEPVDSAESVLARRLAEGEISSDEYLERVAVLKDR